MKKWEKADRTRQNTGKLGEKIAGKFLTSRHFRILNRNFSTPFGEIDIIAELDGELVFFEVRTRTSDKFGSPISSITGKKQKYILKNCRYYLKKHGLYKKRHRIDVIGITLDKNRNFQILRHVKHAVKCHEISGRN